MLTILTTLMTVAGVILAGLAGYVAWRRGSTTGLSLCFVLISVAWWGLAYAVELSVDDLVVKGRWGDAKYVGVCALVPAWLVFVLQYTGRGRLVSVRLLAILAIEPIVLLALLANDATHRLVRFYPDTVTAGELPVVGTGPAFWVNLVYSNVILLGATGLFVASMVKLSRTYWQMALALVAASLLPWVANLLHNFEVGWFARMDLTPFAFIVTGGVLVWGLYRERLVNLTPLARSIIVDNMDDAVFVLDAFGRVVDVNPAAAVVLGTTRPGLVGLPLEELLPRPVTSVAHAEPTQDAYAADELSLGEGPNKRTFDILRQPLTDRRGRAAGELVVLRDLTDRVNAEVRLQHLLDQQSRVVVALQASMVPNQLPEIPMTEMASRYRPAGDGSEIGGDFFDIFALDATTWGVVLGDVSGKGAEAAAVTALARYTLRTLAHPRHSPSHTLRLLNTRLLAATDDERHCTLVYAIARPEGQALRLTLSLAGHSPPLVLRANGAVESVGRLGTALGLFDKPDLHDSNILLTPGDLLCAFTDGLIEARRDGDLFGNERVAAILSRDTDRSVDDVAAELLDAARSFHGGDLTDDLALLILKVRAGDRETPEVIHARSSVVEQV